MRKLLSVAALMAVGLSGLCAETTPAKKTTTVKKKTAARKGSKSTAATPRKAGTRAAHPLRAGAPSHHTAAASASRRSAASASKRPTTSASRRRTTASRRGKRPVRRTTWRNRQLTPTPERYKEIQQALSAKGYLPAGQASGQWDDASAAALKKFQADQNLQASGKINSLSLIALGLGPKHEATTAQKSVNSIAAPSAAPASSTAPASETAPAKPE